MSANRHQTPGRPSATCAWCKEDFATIVELLDHVDADHLEAGPAAA